MAKNFFLMFYTDMNVIGIQNRVNTYYSNFNTKNNKVVSNTVKQNSIKEYNPAYYMPSFKASTEEKFNNLFSKGLEKKLSDNELNQLSDYIYEIKDKVTSDNNKYFMGAGAFGSVYKIDDDYVLKVEKYYFDKKDKKFNYKNENPFNNIPFYYGGILATCDNLSILRNADPKKEAIIAGGPLWYPLDERKMYIQNKSLPAFAGLPQTSFNNYAFVLRLLNGMSYKIDYDKQRKTPDIMNPNNFMIIDDKIRFVDELVTLHKDEKNNIYTMCAPFLNRNMTLSNKEENLKTIDNKREVFKKCVLAAEEAELPIVLNGLYEYERMDTILKTCGYKTKEKDFLSNIETIRNMETDKDMRKELITFYIDNLE